MWTFLAAESAEPLILPDSVQKANLAKAVEKIVAELAGRSIVKEIYVKGRIVNIVAK